jgi:hypothetical protein
MFFCLEVGAFELHQPVFLVQVAEIKNGRVANRRSPVGFCGFVKKFCAKMAGKSHVKRGDAKVLM